MNNKETVKDTIKGYGKKSTFASFLPGIAGVKGTPIWCYYVNRGQAVVSSKLLTDMVRKMMLLR